MTGRPRRPGPGPGIVPEVAAIYRKALDGGTPPDLEETFLLSGAVGQVGVLSVWHRRADLDAMLASGEEPFARRLIRSAGGTPEVTVYDIVVRATSSGLARWRNAARLLLLRLLAWLTVGVVPPR